MAVSPGLALLSALEAGTKHTQANQRARTVRILIQAAASAPLPPHSQSTPRRTGPQVSSNPIPHPHWKDGACMRIDDRHATAQRSNGGTLWYVPWFSESPSSASQRGLPSTPRPPWPYFMCIDFLLRCRAKGAAAKGIPHMALLPSPGHPVQACWHPTFLDAFTQREPQPGTTY